MKAIIGFFVFLCLLSFTTGVEGQYRRLGIFSPCLGCPPKRCVSDKVVVLGYCCGCARVSDHLPIDCPALPLNCPPDGRKLCRDYDYMLNCCCP